MSVVANPTYLAADAAAYSLDLLEDVRREREQTLATVIADLPRHATGSAVIGLAGEELEDLSRRSDVLVVGSRAWGPVRRVLVGSTAARLMRRALCPVLVVPRGSATGQPGEHVPDDSASEPTLHA